MSAGPYKKIQKLLKRKQHEALMAELDRQRKEQEKEAAAAKAKHEANTLYIRPTPGGLISPKSKFVALAASAALANL